MSANAVSPARPCHPLLEVLGTDPQVQDVRAHVADATCTEATIHVLDAGRAPLLASIAQEQTVLVVVATGHEAEELAAELRTYLGDTVAVFPSWETLPHERLSPSVDTVGRRLEILYRLQTNTTSAPADSSVSALSVGATPRVIVAATRSLIQPLYLTTENCLPVSVAIDEDYSFEELTEQLAYRGYRRVDLVSRRGEYAVRGGIIDVFPSTYEHPVRLDFWGDTLTEIRPFSVADQRTLPTEPLTAAEMFPCSELLLTQQIQQAAAREVKTQSHPPALMDMLEKTAEGIDVPGKETLIPLLSDEEEHLLPHYLPQGALTIVCDQEKVRTRTVDLTRTCREFLLASWENAAHGAEAPIDNSELPQGGYRSLRQVRESALAEDGRWWFLDTPGMLAAQSPVLTLDWKEVPAPRGDQAAFQELITSLQHHMRDDKAAPIVIVGPESLQRRMITQCAEQGVVVRTLAEGEELRSHCINYIVGYAQHGILSPQLWLLAEPDITGSRLGTVQQSWSRSARRRHAVDPLALQPGDLVVHDQHGIGRFVELMERTITTGDGTSRREYVVVEYASRRGRSGDKLFVPMDQLDQLSRYVGGDSPALSTMGGSEWRATKRKARKAVREIAGKLVQLYAQRQAAPGHAFSPDTPWQREMEEAFPYVETEDQLRAIGEVKTDMERPTPMDRVVVGDVGYGKTEVAMRAAFKAVQDGRQVVVLVPTTLLAQQHLDTFTQRLGGFPVTIRGLSRFTTTAEAREIIAGLAEGTVDIVIGTHRLLQPQVRWKNLGLVIVDEEQRFGVEHKEHITSLRTHVDVLTLSATPIPRTLEMSLAGIREMSTILTPPEDRQPVLTYVGPYDAQQVAAAIRRELLRDGQVFFVHHRISDITSVAQNIAELVPEARVTVAHGKMSEQTLERTVNEFWDHQWDVLVCTTIVETGLDISNANTLIVDNADRLGLSQMHQLRGRVGRSRERAYAYFLYPAGKTLTTVAYDRLKTIATNNELGAGMAVAMKDLELRGAGNVLGAEQSGHIAGVGFDLYVRLVGEAVEAYRKIADGLPQDPQQGSQDIRLDLPVDAHIPSSYIEGERLRLEAYRKMAGAANREALQQVWQELQDRYGEPPEVTRRLFSLGLLKHCAQEVGVSDIGVNGSSLRISGLMLPDSQQIRLRRYYPDAKYRPTPQQLIVPIPQEGSRIGAPRLRDDDLLHWVAQLLTIVCERPVLNLDIRS